MAHMLVPLCPQPSPVLCCWAWAKGQTDQRGEETCPRSHSKGITQRGQQDMNSPGWGLTLFPINLYWTPTWEGERTRSSP